MTSFLEFTLDQYPEWEDSPSKYVFILPSKRAGYFLKHLMAKRVKRSLIAPEIWSIEDFVAHIAGLNYASEVQLLFNLYEVYLSQEAQEHESFEAFSKWGPQLIQDFNEIDRYLIDSKLLFNTLSNLQEIRNWSPDGGTTPFIEKRLSFWRGLDALYTAFGAKLLEQKMGYQGLVYRKAAAQTSGFCEQAANKKFVFIGFNALNEAESTIIRTFLSAGIGDAVWDADPSYLENRYHEAGHYLRKHLKQWSELKGNLKGLKNHLSTDRSIKIIGIPKTVAQAKYCGLLLDSLLKEDKSGLSGTALILGNEMLLTPIRNSLPDSISSANITMGYPLKDNPAVQLFQILLTQSRQRDEKGWNIRGVLEVLGQPLLKSLFQKNSFNSEKGSAQLIKRTTLYVSGSHFSEIGLPDALQAILFPNENITPEHQLQCFRDLIDLLREVLIEENDRITLEVLFRLDQLFLQIKLLCSEYTFISSLRTLESLFKELLAEEKLDFEGEPLEGLQIMGMLESRNLDFETVIITSVNEGVLPSGKSNNSFIPFDVKREFGLPTYKEKDAVYAYHFYRLLQRAKKVYLLYNTEPDALEGGEPSRFLSQVRTDNVLGRYVSSSIAAPSLKGETAIPKCIPKSESLLLKLKDVAEAGFSPTSLGRFVENPITFYKEKILGIQESPVLEEFIAPNTFGSILHKVLEKIYSPKVGFVLNTKEMEAEILTAPALVDSVFDEEYLKGIPPVGQNLIALNVLKQYVISFLKKDAEAARKHSIRILGIEERLKFNLDVPGLNFTVNLKGTVDRIEEVDGRVQIIDYKSGKVDLKDARIKTWSDCTEMPEKSKALQLLCYAWLFSRSKPNTQLRAGLVSFKNLNAGKIWFGLETAPRKYNEAIGFTELHEFEAELIRLIQNIFNPDIPFSYPEPD